MNYQGVIFGRQKTDFVAGVNSPIERKGLNILKNWDQYRPVHELQNRGFETYACTVFSGFDCQETIANFYLANNLIPENLVEWLKYHGYIIDGKFDFSDRFAALHADIKIGTGTYQYKANNAIRKYLIPEAMLPFDSKNYYDKSVITQEMLDLSAEFCKRITFNWEWEENPSMGLVDSPLSAVVRFANGDGILRPEGKFNHAIMIYKEDEESYFIDDSYSQQDKRYAKDFVVSFCKYSMTINNTSMNYEKFFKENDLKWVQNFNTGQFARIMQGMLRPIVSSDRGALALLDEKVRNNKIIKDGVEAPAKITNAEWEKMNKKDF